ncbi:Processive diacylglycerol beta-glucosyltransferase [compost metagenome]
MDASDLLITKPGGMTCTEGMAKGIPMLFFESIPGQEEKNREYFVQRGFGASLDSPDVLDDWFDIIRGRHAAVSQADPEKAARQDGYRPDRCAGAVISLLHPSAAPARVRLQTAGPAEQRAN